MSLKGSSCNSPGQRPGYGVEWIMQPVRLPDNIGGLVPKIGGKNPIRFVRDRSIRYNPLTAKGRTKKFRYMGCLWRVVCFVLVWCSALMAKPVEILNISYDPTREFYEAYDELFIDFWKKKTGQEVFVLQSHGGSGRQARVIDLLSQLFEAIIST